MAENQITEINNMIFNQIKTLSDNNNIKKEKLHDEVGRSKAMAMLAEQYFAGEVLNIRKEAMKASIENRQTKALEYIPEADIDF